MDILQPMAAVALVLALLGGSLWLLRRRGVAAFRFSNGTAKRMELIERLPLSPQHALHVVRVGEQKFVIATSPSSCSVVSEVQA